mgnify:CR=1 FL=1
MFVQFESLFRMFYETKGALNPNCLKDPLLSLSHNFYVFNNDHAIFFILPRHHGCFINLVIILIVSSTTFKT